MAALQPLDLTQARHELLQRPKASASSDGFTNPPFKGAAQNRLNLDWAVRMLSADQEIRSSLMALRARCRQLGGNNDYASRFLNKIKENVIGPDGIGLEMNLDEDQFGTGAEKLNRQIEDAWRWWCDVADVDGRKNFVDYAQLWMTSKMQDGEAFSRRVKGYPYNEYRFAVQFVDPDMIDVNYQRGQQVDAQGLVINDIRMGVEVDEWRRPLAYYAFLGHPAEMAATRRIRIPAGEIDHAFVFKRINQTRGIPWMASAMTRLNMLGGYEEAELVAARLGACKIAALISKTGDEYKGPKSKTDGAITMDTTPGTIEQLPEGWSLQELNWNHPNAALPDFIKAMLRGAAMGMNLSYSTLAGDLREVNFSSLRQGVLDEREGYRVLQTFAVAHLYRPTFREFLQMAVTAGQLQIPTKLPLQAIERAALWTPRGWDWVDPKKDVDADVASIRSGMNTLKDTAAKRGRNWRAILEQRAKENAYAEELKVPLDFTTSGAGGLEGDQANEDSAHGGANQ
jgi:lambda family phage portal protein